MTIAGDNSHTSRPLLPTDEGHINSQFAKKHELLQRAEVLRDNIGALNSSLRSSSNRNIAELYTKKPAPVQKALTDTHNFIEMYSSKSSGSTEREEESNEEEDFDDEGNLDNEDQSTLESADNISSSQSYDNDNTTSDINEHEMDLDPKLQRQREEWAEKGAAKIVRQVTNPKTGRTTRQVIKKGIKDFKFGDTLGDGSYSTVMLATSKDSGKKYAVKVLSKEYLIRQKKVKYVNIEKNALQRLNNSRGIVKLFFTFQDESSLYFLLEFAPNGDFLSVMKKYGSLSEECACYYGAQIIDAIHFVHSKGIIHRDIKPENILLDKDMKVKLTDFGTAKILDPRSNTTDSFDLLTKSKSFVGTAEYVSPELLNDSYVDYRCDIWAFGCILYQMVAGKPPFKATNEYLTFQKVMKVQYAFTAGFPLVLRDLVKRILVKQPDQRLTIPQIKKHHFFKGKNFSDESIWDNNPPEIQPYKINAKSMQPIPALSTGASNQLKRPIIPRSFAKSAPNLASTPTESSSNLTGRLPPPSITPTVSSSKKVLDERTAQILDNARKAVGSRKSGNVYKRSTSGAASAASAALTKKSTTPPPPSTTVTVSTAVSSSAAPNNKGKVHMTSKSTSSFIALSTHGNGNNSNGLLGSNKKPGSTPALPSVTVATSVSHSFSESDTFPTPAMNKTDITWSYYLKNIEERVIGVGEVNLAVVHSDLLEKRVHKAHGSIAEPQSVGTSRGTLLSQVARGGGGITGFRSDTNIATLPESSYYEEMAVDPAHVAKDYKQPGGDLSLNSFEEMSAPSSAGSTESSEESGNLTGKFKKLFHHNNKNDIICEPVDPAHYLKRMLLVTSFGRCLVFVKKTKNIPNTNINYDLAYDINLCQAGTKLKEIFFPSTDNKCKYFALQTPYNSFVIRTNKHGLDNWFNTINRGIKMKHERLISKSKREDTHRNDALKAARLASPTLEHSFDYAPNASSPLSPAPKTPKTPTSTWSTTTARSTSESKQSSSSSTSNNTNKAGRLFDTFVNSKEKITKRHASPVPLPTRLINGLPSNIVQESLGLGISDLHSGDVHSSPTTPKSSKKTVTSGNSRLLARSEQSFRPKQ